MHMVPRFFVTLIWSMILTAAVVAMPTQAAAAGPCVVPSKIGVTFVIDDSGSMSSTDPDYLRADAFRIALDQLPDGSVVSAGTFDTYSRTVFSPVGLNASNRLALGDEVAWQLSSSGQTDYGEAFGLADELLNATTGVDKRAVIFLSDGEPTSGAYANESMTNADVPIYTVGFGTVLDSTLQRIASYSGGKSFDVYDSSEAQNAFAEIVADLNCDTPVLNQSFDLDPGETRTFDFSVEFLDQFNALAAWDWGTIELKLRRPDGSFLAAGSTLTGEVFRSDSNFASAASTSPAMGGWQVWVTASAGNAGSARVSIDVFNRPTPKDLPVILVSGLNSNTGYVAPDASGITRTCADGGDMATLCDAIARQRYPVFVVPQYWHAKNKNDLDSTKPIDENAVRLTRFIKTNPSGRLFGHARPLFVGHSAGGLVARRAISEYGVQASGLVTIGSPHEGSFAADAATGTLASCIGWVNPVLGAICSGSSTFLATTPLVLDLTKAARSSQKMSRPGIPIWLYVGTGEWRNIAWATTDYVAPNDQWVGKSSASGAGANLGTVRKSEGSVRHSDQPNSAEISGLVKSALTSLIKGDHGPLKLGVGVSRSSNLRRTDANRLGVSAKRRANGKRLKNARVRLEFSALARKLKPRTSIRNQTITATGPFSLSCSRGEVPSVEIMPGVHQADAFGRCRLNGVDFNDSIIAPRKPPRGLSAIATFDRNKHTVRVVVRGAKAAKVRNGKRGTRRMKKSGRTFSVKLTRRQLSRGAFIQVRTRSAVATAPVPAAR